MSQHVEATVVLRLVRDGETVHQQTISQAYEEIGLFHPSLPLRIATDVQDALYALKRVMQADAHTRLLQRLLDEGITEYNEVHGAARQDLHYDLERAILDFLADEEAKRG